MYHQTQQAVGIWPFKSAVDFSESNAKMTDIAWAINRSNMPAQISIKDARKLIAGVTKAISQFASDAKPVIASSPGVRDSLRAAVKAVQWDFDTKIGRLKSIIRTAEAQGKNTVPSFQFNHRDIHLTLLSIVGGYEAVQFIDEAKPFLVRSVPFMIGIFVGIANVVQNIIGIAKSIASGLNQGIKAAGSGMDKLITMLKWGSVAGGLYLLYGALKPKKAGQ